MSGARKPRPSDARTLSPSAIRTLAATFGEKAVPNSGGRVTRLPSYTNDEKTWVTLEVYTVGQQSVHVVDGTVVLVLHNTRLYENGTTRPLTSGKIQLQSEGSELFYRNIEMQSIKEIPAALLQE